IKEPNVKIAANVKPYLRMFLQPEIKEPNVKIAANVKPYLRMSLQSEIKDTNVKIALFPFENFSDEKDKDVLKQVIPVLRSRLEKKGLEILDDESLNRFLLKERIRYSGYIPKDVARKIESELNVKAILTGSVNSFSAARNPIVGLSARLIDSSSGQILWANHASASGEDFITILGIGKIAAVDKLIPKVADRLLASFNTEPPHKEVESTYRIAVMPFQSKAKGAGMVATYMALAELFKNRRFVPVEYGDIRKSVVDLRIRRKGELDYRSIDELSKSLEVDGFLVGTVEDYSAQLDTMSPPKVAISIRLIDAHKKRILWYDSFQMNGDDSIFILDWGRLRTVDEVASRVISTLTKKMEGAKWF
ncbi:MAG: hypothetical protein AABY09_02020, partial [Nanoarchaeota archaeon]